jgi:hypothetical protein
VERRNWTGVPALASACPQGGSPQYSHPSPSRAQRYLDSKEKTSFRPMFFIFVLNNAVSGVIVKQILQEAGLQN